MTEGFKSKDEMYKAMEKAYTDPDPNVMKEFWARLLMTRDPTKLD